MSEPAAKYCRAISRTTSGWLALNSSGHPPGSSPCCCKNVPVAPSETSRRPLFSRSRSAAGPLSLIIYQQAIRQAHIKTHCIRPACAAATAQPDRAIGPQRSDSPSTVIPAPLRHSRESGNPRPHLRHSRESRNPRPHFRHSRESRNPRPHLRHPRESRNPRPHSVIPAKAGTHAPTSVIPAKAGTHPPNRHSRESRNPRPHLRHSRESRNPRPHLRHSRESGNPRNPHAILAPHPRKEGRP